MGAIDVDIYAAEAVDVGGGGKPLRCELAATDERGR